MKGFTKSGQDAQKERIYEKQTEILREPLRDLSS